jgi:preprotein translocase subunit YajC
MLVVIITILALAAYTYRQQRNAARRLAADRKAQLNRFRSSLIAGIRVRVSTGEHGTVDFVGTDIVTIYTDSGHYRYLRKEEIMPMGLN